jgi:hypothetical protein
MGPLTQALRRFTVLDAMVLIGATALGLVRASEVWPHAWLALRLRQPRPERGALWPQPGWCACISAVAGYIAGIAEEAIIEFPCPTVVVPAAVLLAWLALALIRRWSAEPSWIDRAGRCLGLAWIAVVPLFVVGFVLWDW